MIDDDEKFETRWRCWNCKRVFQMTDMCMTDNLRIVDYQGGNFDEILVEVKVGGIASAPIAFNETPGA